jgi:putative transcriptional regulator
MKEYIFKSDLSEQKMEENFAGFDFFEGLMDGLTEALAHSKGKATADTFVRKRSLPDVNVAEIRSDLKMTQHGFASMLGVSPRTVESWESGRTTPTPTAKKLLYLIREDHSLVKKLTEA